MAHVARGFKQWGDALMSTSICYRCGDPKSAAESRCSSCGIIPETLEDLALSMALSRRFSTPTLLQILAGQVRARRALEIPPAILEKARELVEQKRLKSDEKSKSTGAGSVESAVPGRTPLENNPFAALSITVRDNERRILEVVEERSLSEDVDAMVAAGDILRNPRTRLQAELTWLPGVAPSKATSLLNLSRENPSAVLSAAGLPALARANLLASVIDAGSPGIKGLDWVDWIIELSCADERIHSEEATQHINEDRAVARIPLIKSVEMVDSELVIHRRYMQSAVHSRLNSLAATELCDSITRIVERTTAGGTKHAPSMVEVVVAQYSTAAAGALETGATGVRRVLSEIKAASIAGEPTVLAAIKQLASVLRRWAHVAQPIQIVAKSRGQRHELSDALADNIRDVSLFLWKTHEMLPPIQSLNALMLETFADAPVVTEQLRNDQKAIDELAEDKKYEGSLAAVQAQCNAAAEAAAKRPKFGIEDGSRLLDEARTTCEDMGKAGAPVRVILNARDRFAAGALSCAITYGNSTELWTGCIRLVQRAVEIAATAEMKKRLEDNLTILRKNEKRMIGLTPISSPPSLQTVNGFGMTIYGRTDVDPESGSYLTTYYLVLLLIPVLPLARYRVTDAGNRHYNFIGKAPLRVFDKWHIGVVIAGVICMIIFGR